MLLSPVVSFFVVRLLQFPSLRVVLLRFIILLPHHVVRCLVERLLRSLSLPAPSGAGQRAVKLFCLLSIYRGMPLLMLFQTRHAAVKGLLLFWRRLTLLGPRWQGYSLVEF